MKYVLALFDEESPKTDRSPEERAESMRAWDGFTRALNEEGAFLGGEGLQPSETATTVRIPISGGGSAEIVDGPFAETKEQLGGYYLIDCEDLDAALGWARRVPMPGGTVEVRPVMDYAAAGSREHDNRAEVSR